MQNPIDMTWTFVEGRDVAEADADADAGLALPAACAMGTAGQTEPLAGPGLS
jgi:hypothetical protein